MIELNEIIRQFPKELQKSEFYDQMVKEYIHHHILQILFTTKHANKISFLGGTAIRLFYGLKRFSEGLDFDCFDLSKDQFFEMTDKVAKELLQNGFDVVIEDKKKHDNLKAFRRVFVFPELKFKLGLSQQREAKFFIKIEAESHNIKYKPDIKILNGFGITAPINVVPVNLMFSTKISAALTRKKDRDFFDIIHLIAFSKPDFDYLNKKYGIDTPAKLKTALLEAANSKQLDKRTVYDCDHMLFSKNDNQKIKNFIMNISSIDFDRF
jgi:predicted nucleotidyltransferase component of viral defense system